MVARLLATRGRAASCSRRAQLERGLLIGDPARHRPHVARHAHRAQGVGDGLGQAEPFGQGDGVPAGLDRVGVCSQSICSRASSVSARACCSPGGSAREQLDGAAVLGERLGAVGDPPRDLPEQGVGAGGFGVGAEAALSASATAAPRAARRPP